MLEADTDITKKYLTIDGIVLLLIAFLLKDILGLCYFYFYIQIEHIIHIGAVLMIAKPTLIPHKTYV